MAVTDRKLTYRIVDGPVDLDVTAHIQGTPELTWNAVGGCETARLRLDLPLSTFPTLGRRSLLIVTDQGGRPAWYGYCTDPGKVDDDDGQAFDLTADGSMSVASLRVGRLVYLDPELGSWTRSRSSVETAQVGQVDDETFTGWRVGHPEGQAIGTGAVAGIEYRHLANADHGIGRLAATLIGAADDPGFDVVIATYAEGDVVDSLSVSLTSTPLALDLIAGEDIGVGCDAVQIAVVRTGLATNVTTPLAFVDIPTLVVEGAIVDQWGDLVTPGEPVTSARVVADLIGRGLLGPVDPDAAVIVDTGVAHSRLSWATGIRGSAALEKLREVDSAATWMYGTRGPGGFAFSWTPWTTADTNAADGVRYEFGDLDAITSTGSTELPADRVRVVWTDSEGEERSLTVELATAADPSTEEFTRDLDPIVLGESTSEAAAQAGLDALTTKADVGRTITVTVARQVLDRGTGLEVEPHELRPGCLARLEATGEVLRVQTVTATSGEAGGTATLTLGDPPGGLTERLLAVVRGEIDPTAPLIPPRPVTPLPPQTSAPRPPELDELADQILGAIATANGKNKITGATRAPTGSDPGVEGDTWYYYVAGNIYAVYSYTSGSWVPRKLRDEMIDTLSVGKISGLDAAFLNARIDHLNSVDITSTGSGKTVTISDGIVSFNGVPVYGSGSLLLIFGNAQVWSDLQVSGSLNVDDYIYGVLDGSLAGDTNCTGVFHAYRLEGEFGSTTNAANCYIDSSGRLFKSSSSVRYKNPVRKADLNAAADALLELDAEVYTSNNDETDTTHEHIGWYAERLHEFEALRPWVDYDTEGRPDGIGYGGIVVPLLALVQRQQEQIAALAARLDAAGIS